MNLKSIACRLAAAAALALAAVAAHAQFVSGQLLTAAALNSALAAPTITNGTITGLTAPLAATLGGLGLASPTANAVLVGNGSSAVQAVGPGTTGQVLIGVNGAAPVWGSNPAISGGTITNSPISGSTGSFTTLSASSTVSGAGFTSLLAPYAPLASPTFTGTVTIPSGASISGYLTTSSAASIYAPLASPTFTGTVTIPSGASISGYLTTSSAASTYAPIASPALSGTPTAPTASAGTSTTQIATTAFAQNAVTGGGNAGSFTTIAASGIITPSQTAGIAGTTTNNSANAGSVGEYVCAQVTNGGSPTGCQSNSSTPVSLSSGTTQNIASISLTAGDWDVDGVVCFTPTSSTSVTNMTAGISSTSVTLGPMGSYSGLSIPFSGASGGSCIATAVGPPIKLATTSTIYLISQQSFSASTMTATGFIRARRPR